MPPIDLEREANNAANNLWNNSSSSLNMGGYMDQAQRPQVKLPPLRPSGAAGGGGMPQTTSIVQNPKCIRLPFIPSLRQSQQARGIFSHVYPVIHPTIPEESQARDRARAARAAGAVQARFTATGVSLPNQKPSTDEQWKEYHKNYAEMVRKEAVQKAVKQIFNSPQETDTSSMNDEFQEIANRWIAGVRLHDSLSDSHLFKNKPRGHGREADSTNGRLLRKLIMAAVQKRANAAPELERFRKAISDAENMGEGDDKEKRLDAANQQLNNEIAGMLNGLLQRQGGSLALKKAIFLTKEKLTNPLEYKKKYARLVPFGDNEFVKASRRFYTPASIPLLLPDREDRSKRKDSTVRMGQPPDMLPKFGPSTEQVSGGTKQRELIEDVGQKDLSDCWLQASAASLPRHVLENMFSWRPSYGRAGVTTRLHDEKGKPIYIRTRMDELWNDASEHKALWPAVMEAAAAKVGRPALRDFRKTNDFIPRDMNGMPIYSVRDLYGNTLEEAAKLLTGKPPLINAVRPSIAMSDKNRAIRGTGYGVGLVPIRDHITGRIGSHAITFYPHPQSNNKGTFGNPWVNAVRSGVIGEGRKIFNIDLSEVERLGFLDPTGAAAPQRGEFYPQPASLAPYKNHQRRLIGNISI
jgi:hypothetical protein